MPVLTLYPLRDQGRADMGRTRSDLRTMSKILNRWVDPSTLKLIRSLDRRRKGWFVVASIDQNQTIHDGILEWTVYSHCPLRNEMIMSRDFCRADFVSFFDFDTGRSIRVVNSRALHARHNRCGTRVSSIWLLLSFISLGGLDRGEPWIGCKQFWVTE